MVRSVRSEPSIPIARSGYHHISLRMAGLSEIQSLSANLSMAFIQIYALIMLLIPCMLFIFHDCLEGWRTTKLTVQKTYEYMLSFSCLRQTPSPIIDRQSNTLSKVLTCLYSFCIINS